MDIERFARELINIDKILHEKARLAISTLLFHRGRMDFNTLKRLLEISDGNLSSHLRVLEDSGYIKVEKRFVGRRPQTLYELTSKGKKAYQNYLSTLARAIRFGKEKL